MKNNRKLCLFARVCYMYIAQEWRMQINRIYFFVSLVITNPLRTESDRYLAQNTGQFDSDSGAVLLLILRFLPYPPVYPSQRSSKCTCCIFCQRQKELRGKTP